MQSAWDEREGLILAKQCCRAESPTHPLNTLIVGPASASHTVERVHLLFSFFSFPLFGNECVKKKIGRLSVITLQLASCPHQYLSNSSSKLVGMVLGLHFFLNLYLYAFSKITFVAHGQGFFFNLKGVFAHVAPWLGSSVHFMLSVEDDCCFEISTFKRRKLSRSCWKNGGPIVRRALDFFILMPREIGGGGGTAGLSVKAGE